MKREIRPRFEVETEERMDELMARVTRLLRAPDCPLCGVVASGRIELYVPPARQRLWSPELQLDVRRSERGTVLEGTYAPHPHVWVGYVAVTAVALVAMVAAFTFAIAQWMMRTPTVALYAIPPLALVCAGTYALAFVGQRLATDEMDELRAFVDDVVFSSVPLPSGIRSRVPDESESARRAG